MRRSSGESADAEGETWGDLLVFWSLWRFDLLARDGRESRVHLLEMEDRCLLRVEGMKKRKEGWR